ncbi:MAG: maleylpyruvate isomerase family mycothiol-dependent enzyme [Nitriliruptorales bacterium]|nr:maleylpyruvate isomerase family mycothiol-dependent enzyme [Nitriliruptorales bacterium]
MDLLGALGREASAFYTAATDLHRPVPSCPAWDVADLVHHLGRAHHFWRRVAEGVEDEEGVRQIRAPQRPNTAQLVPWAEHETDMLLAVLDGLDPDAPRWNWSRAPNTAAFIARRMAHETAVHRWDIENAAGGADPVGHDLAADGVDEFLTLFLSRGGSYDGPEGVLRLAATDAGAEWIVNVAAPHPEVVSGEHDPDATVATGASDLLLMLWGRLPAEEDLLAALVAATDRD